MPGAGVPEQSGHPMHIWYHLTNVQHTQMLTQPSNREKSSRYHHSSEYPHWCLLSSKMLGRVRHPPQLLLTGNAPLRPLWPLQPPPPTQLPGTSATSSASFTPGQLLAGNAPLDHPPPQALVPPPLPHSPCIIHTRPWAPIVP